MITVKSIFLFCASVCTDSGATERIETGFKLDLEISRYNVIM